MRPFEWKVALFDLDGVVFDTEAQYSVFWGTECRRYHPGQPGLEQTIKGQTLTQIFDRYFSDLTEEQPHIVERLNAFERDMRYDYLPGFVDFISGLRSRGVKTAVVTSSNQAKMESVYRHHPEFRGLFDAVLTSEDFAESKPSPDCYLKGAARFGAAARECVVFEDSFNGLRSGRAAGMYVIGLATTNSAEAIAPLADEVWRDYLDVEH